MCNCYGYVKRRMHRIKEFSIACSRRKQNQMYIQVHFLMGQLGVGLKLTVNVRKH